ncbi:hypothetical protein IWQ61_002704 [Dispira simplex]|nr:hypothetical protein IWQ61_002704 [Dispira simplex]
MPRFPKTLSVLAFLFGVLYLNPHVFARREPEPPVDSQQPFHDVQSLEKYIGIIFNTTLNLNLYGQDQVGETPDSNDFSKPVSTSNGDMENSENPRNTRLRHFQSKFRERLKALKFWPNSAEAENTSSETSPPPLANENTLVGPKNDSTVTAVSNGNNVDAKRTDSQIPLHPSIKTVETENNAKANGMDSKTPPPPLANGKAVVESENDGAIKAVSKNDVKAKDTSSPIPPLPVDQSRKKWFHLRGNVNAIPPPIQTNLNEQKVPWNDSPTVVGSSEASLRSYRSLGSLRSALTGLPPMSSRSSQRSNSIFSHKKTPSGSSTSVTTLVDSSDTPRNFADELKRFEEKYAPSWSSIDPLWLLKHKFSFWSDLLDLNPLDKVIVEFRRKYPEDDFTNEELVDMNFAGPHIRCLVFNKCPSAKKNKKSSSMEKYLHRIQVFKSIYLSWRFLRSFDAKKCKKFYIWIQSKMEGHNFELFTLQQDGFPLRFYLDPKFRKPMDQSPAGLYVFDMNSPLDKDVMSSFRDHIYTYDDENTVLIPSINAPSKYAKDKGQDQPNELAHPSLPPAVTA